MEEEIASRLATLGHPARMAIFRLLMRRHPDRVPAGKLAEALGLKASTLSAHLSALVRDGLIGRERTGTSLRYAIAMRQVRRSVDDMLLDCCRDRPDVCSPVSLSQLAGPGAMPDHRHSVLFIRTGDSARSIFAESILRREAGDRLDVHSAGTGPRSELNPFALEVLEQKGHDISVLRAKNVSEVQGEDAPTFDFVFTVCNQAANEENPAWTGQRVSAQRGMPDPVKAQGTDAQKSHAFPETCGALFTRIKAVAARPLAAFDRISLQRVADGIGGPRPGAPA